jgi:ubiquinone/menaquinone biosynthesis C-methylase UbiE
MQQKGFDMTRLRATGANAAEIERWNSAHGERWADDAFRARQDRAQGPFGEAAMDALGLQDGQHVLDIGCGSGSTTFELAARVGPAGHVLGVDISAPQLESARRRARALGLSNVAFENQDAAVFPFATAVFDRAFSRFGVMFFTQPVDAFANIRSGLKPGGRIAFACWQTRERNPWLTMAVTVAIHYLPAPAPVAPEAPGAHAFSDPQRVNRILSEAGFTSIEITPVEHALQFEPDIAGTAAQLIQYGPMATAIAEAPENIRERIKTDLGEAIQGYQTSDGVRIDGAVWIVSAECSA